MDYHRDNRNNHYERIGDIWLTDAPYFILGDYDKTKYYPEENTEDHFTLDIEEARAFLCVSNTYKDIETCTYDSGFYIRRVKSESDIKLVSWPDKQLIAETSATTSTPAECALLLNTRYLGDHLVEVTNIDIWKWFSNYK